MRSDGSSPRSVPDPAVLPSWPWLVVSGLAFAAAGAALGIGELVLYNRLRARRR